MFISDVNGKVEPQSHESQEPVSLRKNNNMEEIAC